MIFSIILVAIAAYVSVCLLTYVFVARVVTDRALRGLFLMLTIATPIIAIFTVFYALCGQKIPPVPITQELADVEQEIEAERMAIYGGTPIKPSLAETMRNAYLKSLARTTKTVDSVTGSHWNRMVPSL